MSCDKKSQVLLISLWILAILTILVAGIGHRVSIALRISDYQRNKLKGLCLAKAGINKAIRELEKDTNNYDALNESWAAEKDEEEVKYSICDEERKININTASKELLDELLGKIGVINPLDIANNICAWRGDADENIPDYTDLGYSNKGDKFTNVEELILVKDIDEETFSNLEPLITVWGDYGRVNINTVSQEILEILVGYCIKELERRGVTERNPEDLIDRIIELRLKDVVFTSVPDLETDLGDLLSRHGPRNILNELERLIDFKSSCFYIVSNGKIRNNITGSIHSVFNRSNERIIYWHEN